MKSIKLLLLSFYLIGIGLVFSLVFIQLNVVNTYIQKGFNGRIQSVLEDLQEDKAAINEFKNESERIIYRNNLLEMASSIISISFRNMIEITTIMTYQKVVVLCGVICYILSGLCLFKRSRKYKFFFYVGAFSCIVWISTIGLISSRVLEHSQECFVAVNNFIQSVGDQALEPFDENHLAKMRYSRWLWSFILFVVFVALPAYLISRFKISDQDKGS